MRKQYYFRNSPRGLLAWDVDRLVQLSSALPRKAIPLSTILELHQAWSDEPQAGRGMLEHLRLIDEADLSLESDWSRERRGSADQRPYASPDIS